MRPRALASMVATLGLGLVLLSCDRPTPPEAEPDALAARDAPGPLEGYSHTLMSDVSGFYMPLSAVSVGRWQLHHLFVGRAGEFVAFEGGERSETFAPLMFEFHDMSSPRMANEMGAEVPSISARVLPSAYLFDGEQVRFAGQHPELGPIRFEGTIDAGALAQSRRTLGGDRSAVLSGTLSVGSRTFEGQQFLWWAGD